ncbi:MAG TPA: serine/threonine-protein kinase, partial [Gemmatimonadales bacterium]
MSDLPESLREALADRYAIERELGRGGMATVYLAEDRKHRRPVAIKVLHPELAAALGAERFLREIEIAARLQHPHILPLYDSGSAGGQLYYVMPYVEGESLRDRLSREQQLPLEDALRIATEVAGALAYAHSHGIVHRDIKPENIMLSGGTAVVADFGIAHAVTAAGEGHDLTQTGTIIGTPAYMSPEQATGSAELDGRSDEYSLACVVYEMVVGEPPFTGPTAQAIIARHSLDMVSPPSIVRATIPDAVEDAILRALAKVPADRYPTTALFAEALNTPSRATGAARRATLARRAGAPRGAGWRIGLAGGAL